MRTSTWGAGTLDAEAEERFVQGAVDCERFFMGEAEVMKALNKLVGILDDEGSPHAVIGALALELGADLAGELHPYVRDKFVELWRAAQTQDPYE